MQSEIDRRLAESITNAQLAECARMSQYHFARMFRRSTGLSPQGYVLRRRIERAMHLMLTTDAPLCEIALDCGFTDQSHLSRRFADALGAAPRAWRRERLIRRDDATGAREQCLPVEINLFSPRTPPGIALVRRSSARIEVQCPQGD